MAVNEQIITGRKFRKLINETTKLWQRISFWTKASDVEFNDGKTAEAKLGAINGITSDLSCTDSSMAASAAALNQVNRSFSDACNTIKAAITGKGVTPSSSKPADLAEAINQIQAKGTISKITTATLSCTKLNVSEQKTISLKSYENYASLTLDDIVLSGRQFSVSQNTFAYVGYMSVTKYSYNATNGVLTVKALNAIQKDTNVVAPISMKVDVYAIK